MRNTTAFALTAVLAVSLATVAAFAQAGAQSALPTIENPATYVGVAPRPPVPGAPVAAPAPAPAIPPITAPFYTRSVGSDVKGIYVVTPADMNKDGKQDIVVLGQREDYLIWYENPYWTRHVVKTATTLPGMVNMDVADIDNDGMPEIAVTYLFDQIPSKSVGNIAILRSTGGNPDAPWTTQVIDAAPSPHRILFADVDGNGRKAVIVAPIQNPKAQGVPSNDPDQLPTPVFVYRGPEWKRELVTNANLGFIHGLYLTDWNDDGKQDIVTSGHSGTFVHTLEKNGKWKRTMMTAGNPAPWPDNGSSDATVGMIGGKRFFATIEPFHGNLVVVYTQDAKGKYQRKVIDNRLQRGHTMVMEDIDHDGTPEIVVGSSGGTTSQFYYKATDSTGQNWSAMLMDTVSAASNCKIAHLRDPKVTDVLCTNGRAPTDIRWYEYTGK